MVQPGSDAAVLRVRGTNKALAMTTDCNSRYLYLNPEIGGQIAVAEAARNIVASGAQPLAITDCLNYGSLINQKVLGIMDVGGWNRRSLPSARNTRDFRERLSYNETDGQAIYPTPMIGMVGVIEDVSQITTQAFKQVDDLIYLIGETHADFNGSEIQKCNWAELKGNYAHLI